MDICFAVSTSLDLRFTFVTFSVVNVCHLQITVIGSWMDCFDTLKMEALRKERLIFNLVVYWIHSSVHVSSRKHVSDRPARGVFLHFVTCWCFTYSRWLLPRLGTVIGLLPINTFVFGGPPLFLVWAGVFITQADTHRSVYYLLGRAGWDETNGYPSLWVKKDAGERNECMG